MACTWGFYTNTTNWCVEKPANCRYAVGQKRDSLISWAYNDIQPGSASNMPFDYNFDNLRANCFQCVDGQSPQQGQCFPNCARVQKSWNLTTYRFDASCCTCKQGYYLNGTTCYKCSDPNCVSCTFNSATDTFDKCQLCDQTSATDKGYYVLFVSQNNQCAQCNKYSQNCAAYDGTSAGKALTGNQCVCTTCTSKTLSDTYYTLATNNCTSIQDAEVTYCAQYGSTKGKCTRCRSGYALNVGTSPAADTCVTINNCMTYNTTAYACVAC